MDLNVIPTHRFKTEEEFRKRYGDKWNYYIPNGWGDPMTKLLSGRPFMSSILPSISNDNSVSYTLLDNIHSYDISIEMLTLIPKDDTSWMEYVEERKEHEKFLKRFSVRDIDPHHKSIIYKLVYSVGFEIYYKPTNNCQLSCIASLNNIISRYSDPNDIKNILKGAKEVCKWNKKLYMFDVAQGYVKSLKPLLYNNIEPTFYQSTNGTNMAYGLLYID